MKAVYKHFICVSFFTVIVLFMAACHKENSSSGSNNISNNNDSLTVIGQIIDSTVGRYWCAHHSYSSSPIRYNFDTILGYDTVTVIKVSTNTILVNGESFTYGIVNLGPIIDTGFLNGNIYSYSSVGFRSHYDSINYTDNAGSSAGGSWESYYSGKRLN